MIISWWSAGEFTEIMHKDIDEIMREPEQLSLF